MMIIAYTNDYLSVKLLYHDNLFLMQILVYKLILKMNHGQHNPLKIDI
jgi:hypothetical protein